MQYQQQNLALLLEEQQRQKVVTDAKLSSVQSFISESEAMGTLQKALSRKYLLYLKKGLTHEEASSKLLRKFVHKKVQEPHQYIDPELYQKMKKALGFSYEDSHNTLQLKTEIDKLFQEKNQEFTVSSEESSSHDWDLSPRS